MDRDRVCLAEIKAHCRLHLPLGRIELADLHFRHVGHSPLLHLPIGLASVPVLRQLTASRGQFRRAATDSAIPSAGSSVQGELAVDLEKRTRNGVLCQTDIRLILYNVFQSAKHRCTYESPLLV